MRCPKCGDQDDKVIDSRASREGATIRRRRECAKCGHRFTTYEEVEHEGLMVLKSDGRREEFSREKLLSGLKKACQKRPISLKAMDDLVDHIVAVAVELDTSEERFFMVWGRIQDKVDPEPLEQLIMKYCIGYDLGGKPVKTRLCWSLQEAAHAPYFYEGLLSFSQTHIPFGDQYEAWRNDLHEKMQQGKEFYYLGNPGHFAKKKS